MGGNPTSRLVRWQVLTAALLVTGYAGYYLCRSDLSVALPLILEDLQARGISPDVAKVRLGFVASLGVLAYALGKFPSGALADFLGGRRNFLVGMAGAVSFTLLFAMAGSLPLFSLAWAGNRLIQSLGWAGLVKITSKWFSSSMYGTAMGVISLSFLFGDAAARMFMAALIRHGLGWRAIFLGAAGVLFLLFLIDAILLKESPRCIGEQEPPANPRNVFGDAGERPVPAGVRELLLPLFRDRGFWLVCLLSLGITLVRETFNLWTPTYFTQVAGLSQADAAQNSALFPFSGGISVLLCGILSDRWGRASRVGIVLAGMALTGCVLLTLAYGNFAGSRLWPVLLVTLVGFLMTGPYSYLAGAISLDFGGKQGSATASGFIDGVGYLGGVLAGDSFARVSIAFGWRGAFIALAGAAFLSSAAAWVYLAHQRSVPALRPAAGEV